MNTPGSGQHPATEDDVKNGIAAFHIPNGRSRVYELGRPLPLKARPKTVIDCGEDELSPETILEVIQCEIVDEQEILVGFTVNGEMGVCTLEEIELIDQD